MTGKGWLLATAAVAGAAAWTAAASAATLMVEGLWDHAYFARGHAWAWAWLTYLVNPAARASMGPSLAAGAMAASLPGVLAIRLSWSKLAGAKPLHGKSAWATRREAERNGIAYSRAPRGDSILLGRTGGFLGLGRRYIGLPGTDHVSLYARTGAGKGVSFVVPTCLAWEGSLVAFDIKGELHRLTAGRRADLGQDVFFFAPTAPDGRSHRYNPFSAVPRGEDGCIDAIHRIMHILIPPSSKKEQAFWTDSARALAAASAVILAETPGEPLNMAAVLRMFTRPDTGDFIKGLIERARSSGTPLPRVATETVLGWIGSEDPKTREGIVAELKTHFALYGSPQIAAATEASDFDLGALRSRGMSIFIGIGPADLRRLRPLVALLFQQIIDRNTQAEFGQDATHSHRILMMLDEFGSSGGRMDMLADAAAFVRSYGIRMAYVLQTKAQLGSIYGQEGADNLLQNTACEIAFGASDLKLCKEISERAGMDTVVEATRSRPRFIGWLHPHKQTESEAARRRALLLPQEVARMPADEQLVFRPGMMALKTRRVMWFEEWQFRRMAEPAPPVPALNVRIERDADGRSSIRRPPAWNTLP